MSSFLFFRKSRKNHCGLRLTALVLMLSLICPCAGTAWAAPRVKTVDLETEASARADEFAEILHRSFNRDFDLLWEQENRDDQLKHAIKKSINELPADYPLPRSLALSIEALRERAIEPVQKLVELNFKRDYDNFMREVQDSFNVEYGNLLVEYYEWYKSRILREMEDPDSTRFIEESSKKLLANNAAELKKRILARLRQGRPSLYIAEGAVGIGLALGVAAFYEPLGDLILAGLVKTGLLSPDKLAAAGTTLGRAGTLGVILFAAGASKIAYDLWYATDNLQLFFEDVYGKFFINEAADKLWLGMENYVKEGFVAVEKEIQDTVSEAYKFRNSPEGKEYTEGMSEERAQDASEKLIMFANKLHISPYDPGLKEDFGSVIKNMPIRHIPTLAEMAEINYDRAKLWVKVTEPSILFDLLGVLPKGIWKKYTPDQKSIDTFQWLTKFTPDAQELAAGLTSDDLQWVITGIEDQYWSSLFANASSVPDLKKTIDELRGIPIKSLRIPGKKLAWYWEYAPYGIMAASAILLLLGKLSLFCAAPLIVLPGLYKLKILPLWAIGLLVVAFLAFKFRHPSSKEKSEKARPSIVEKLKKSVSSLVAKLRKNPTK